MQTQHDHPVAAAITDLHENEEGTVSWAFLVAIIFMMILGGLVYNAGNTINRKIEIQNAADSIAYSGSAWVARGMNAITASNHLIGELAALYVLHHSLGGKHLDDDRGDNNQPEIESLNAAIEWEYNLVQTALIPPAAPGPVTDSPQSDMNSAVYEAMLQLKQIMAAAYALHGVSYLIYLAGSSAGLFGLALIAIGIAGMVAALAVELKVIQEYYVLKVVERVAGTLTRPKKEIPNFIRRVYDYQQIVFSAVPLLARSSANAIAEKHDIEGTLRGDLPNANPTSLGGLINEGLKIYPSLPVEPEDTTNERRSQLMRATYPWVIHWRRNINRFFRLSCTLSGAEGFYRKWTNRYSLQTCQWLRQNGSRAHQLTIANYERAGRNNGPNGKNVKLYVMVGLNRRDVDKSQESWNQRSEDDREHASKQIEDMFTHMAFAERQAPKIGGHRFFRQENPRGMLSFAQSMVYNANPQQEPKRSAGGGAAQPQVGWDTLNWVGGAVEYQTNQDKSRAPRIKLNWQAKLTPVTERKLVRVFTTLPPGGSIQRHLLDCREALVPPGWFRSLTNH